MNILQKIEELGGKMKWYDFSILKMSVFFATLFLITAIPGFRDFVLEINWSWYFILMIIFTIPLLKKMLSK